MTPDVTLSVEHADLAAGTVECTVTVRATARTVPLTITTVEHGGGRLRLEATAALDRTIFPMLPPVAGVSRVVDVVLTVAARMA